MKHPLLTLCPDDPSWTPPDNRRLQHFLQLIQLIGKPFNHQMHYLTGEKFLDLIAFVGCSPDIALEPQDDDRPFCLVHIQEHADAIEFHCGDQTHEPRCPHCRNAVINWQTRINSWLEADVKTLWECEACHSQAEPWRYNWRRSAGFGRCFIEISNIFPKEAIPQQQLLDTLHSHFGINWHYFYQH